MKIKQNGLYLLSVFSLLLSSELDAVTFDPSLLAGASSESDISRFYKKAEMPAGTYEMNIYVNGSWKGRYTVIYGEQQGDVRLSTTIPMLLGINIQGISSSAVSQGQIQLQDLVQGGSFETDTSTLSVSLTVPQASILKIENNYLPPKFWDKGIPALMLSWNTTYYNTHAKTGIKSNSDYLYAGLESGVNFLGWQFRDNSTWRKSSGNSETWQNNTRYLRRPIAVMQSNLSIGDMHTPGNLFESLRVRGVSVATDMQMKPNSQQGFSPIIRGVARTNALVKVLQNGNVIYQENVPPGQFRFDTIQSTGSAGDLNVIVNEADGSQQVFTIPFSMTPGMLKEGVSEYNVVAGKVHQSTLDADPWFVQGTLRYGFNNLISGYTGAIISDNYHSGLLGSGWNLPFGAISLDVTHAETQLQQHKDSGQSFRLSYSKFIDSTATNFTIAAYRYSTKGYYSFSDALYSRESYHRLKQHYEDRFSDIPDMIRSYWETMNSARPKNTFTISLNQRFSNNWGTLFFSGTQRDYWTLNTTSREYQMGYSNSFRSANYTLSASRVLNSNQKEETRIYASVSLPLSLFNKNTWISSSISTRDLRYGQSNISISGNALESNRLSYSLSGSHARNGSSMGSFNTAYKAGFSTLGASYSESSNHRQSGLSSRGSLVAFPWHVLASNEIGTTMTIVDAPEAAGLMVNGDESIKTNKNGLALIPYSTPYRKNVVTLSQTKSSSGADVVGNIANSIPYDGAVNYLRFETDNRQSWQLRVARPDGKPLPFGAEVFNEQNVSVGYVGQASTLYLRAEKKPMQLFVQLRDGRCEIITPPYGINIQPSVCHL